MTIHGVTQREARPFVPDSAEHRAPGLPDPSHSAGRAGSTSRERQEIAAPRGTDPDLWRILSREEREAFSKLGAMGPLTYGYLIHSGRTDMPIVRGGKLDVRG